MMNGLVRKASRFVLALESLRWIVVRHFVLLPQVLESCLASHAEIRK